MAAKVSMGDFKELGVILNNDIATFTYPVNSISQTAIVLFDRSTKKLVDRIEVPLTYHLGLVFSVSVSGFSFQQLVYLIEENGNCRMDLYARSVVGRETWNDINRYQQQYQLYCGFPTKSYEWQCENCSIPTEEMIIYKLHMRGFTMQNKLGKSRRGNFRGLIQKLDDLVELGVTSLEFMPLYDFEELMYHIHLQMDEHQKSVEVFEKPYATNYWGYGNAYYFAPKASYFGGLNPDYHMKEMVDEIHARNMELIMEISFHPQMSEDEMVDALIFWMKEYHIDGFHLLGLKIPIQRIVSNPYLGTVKIFYDHFSTDILQTTRQSKHLFVYDENFLYPMRKLQNHMDGNVAEFSNYLRRQDKNYSFVNYAASNTGFTLWDSYSYGEKHNEANGEENRDGSNYNCSNNHGCEGETNNNVVNRVRMQCVRTALASVLLAQSVPLILSGDEVANSQQGNNNPYCQDNEIGWVHFSRRKAPLLLKEYVKHLIAFRKEHPVLSLNAPMRMNDYQHSGIPDLSYHGKEPWIMGIGDEKKALGILYNGFYGPKEDEDDVMLCFNFYYGEETFALPRLSRQRKWFFVNNTGSDVWNSQEELLKDQSFVIVPGGTVSILIGRKEKDESI